MFKFSLTRRPGGPVREPARLPVRVTRSNWITSHGLIRPPTTPWQHRDRHLPARDRIPLYSSDPSLAGPRPRPGWAGFRVQGLQAAAQARPRPAARPGHGASNSKSESLPCSVGQPGLSKS
jgi:hypothetical protein